MESKEDFTGFSSSGPYTQSILKFTTGLHNPFLEKVSDKI